jgi:hypothetical protein
LRRNSAYTAAFFMPLFQIGKAADGCVVRVHMAVFNLVNGLPADPDDVAQPSLRHAGFAAQCLRPHYVHRTALWVLRFAGSIAKYRLALVFRLARM